MPDRFNPEACELAIPRAGIPHSERSGRQFRTHGENHPFLGAMRRHATNRHRAGRVHGEAALTTPADAGDAASLANAARRKTR